MVISVIPLLVCDDSAMARKQLIRALPPEWPVSITQASQGEEAMAAIRQGLGEVVLLDLTMPVMDGYQVLAQVREEGHACRILVVSGDVQEEARRRVTELGALAFIRKPAPAEALRETLDALGLLQLSVAGTDAAAADPRRSGWGSGDRETARSASTPRSCAPSATSSSWWASRGGTRRARRWSPSRTSAPPSTRSA